MVGIASRPFVESLFSGIVISFSDQLHVGDTLIIDDQYGTVEDISITHTKIKTWEWKRYVIPNSRMLTKEFIHLPLKEQGLWATVEFWISYDADLERVKEIAENVAAGFVAEDSREKPVCWVRRMEKDSVVCCVACLADSPSAAWMLKSDVSIGLSKAFREHNIPTNITHLEIDSKGKV